MNDINNTQEDYDTCSTSTVKNPSFKSDLADAVSAVVTRVLVERNAIYVGEKYADAYKRLRDLDSRAEGEAGILSPCVLSALSRLSPQGEDVVERIRKQALRGDLITVEDICSHANAAGSWVGIIGNLPELSQLTVAAILPTKNNVLSAGGLLLFLEGNHHVAAAMRVPGSPPAWLKLTQPSLATLGPFQGTPEYCLPKALDHLGAAYRIPDAPYSATTLTQVLNDRRAKYPSTAVSMLLVGLAPFRSGLLHRYYFYDAGSNARFKVVVFCDWEFTHANNASKYLFDEALNEMQLQLAAGEAEMYDFADMRTILPMPREELPKNIQKVLSRLPNAKAAAVQHRAAARYETLKPKGLTPQSYVNFVYGFAMAELNGKKVQDSVPRSVLVTTAKSGEAATRRALTQVGQFQPVTNVRLRASGFDSLHNFVSKRRQSAGMKQLSQDELRGHLNASDMEIANAAMAVARIAAALSSRGKVKPPPRLGGTARVDNFPASATFNLQPYSFEASGIEYDIVLVLPSKTIAAGAHLYAVPVTSEGVMDGDKIYIGHVSSRVNAEVIFAANLPLSMQLSITLSNFISGTGITVSSAMGEVAWFKRDISMFRHGTLPALCEQGEASPAKPLAVGTSLEGFASLYQIPSAVLMNVTAEAGPTSDFDATSATDVVSDDLLSTSSTCVRALNEASINVLYCPKKVGNTGQYVNGWFHDGCQCESSSQTIWAMSHTKGAQGIYPGRLADVFVSVTVNNIRTTNFVGTSIGDVLRVRVALNTTWGSGATDTKYTYLFATLSTTSTEITIPFVTSFQNPQGRFHPEPITEITMSLQFTVDGSAITPEGPVSVTGDSDIQVRFPESAADTPMLCARIWGIQNAAQISISTNAQLEVVLQRFTSMYMPDSVVSDVMPVDARTLALAERLLQLAGGSLVNNTSLPEAGFWGDVWNDLVHTLKAYVKPLLPEAGAVLGAFGGPVGVAIGGAVGTALSNAMASDFTASDWCCCLPHEYLPMASSHRTRRGEVSVTDHTNTAPHVSEGTDLVLPLGVYFPCVHANRVVFDEVGVVEGQPLTICEKFAGRALGHTMTVSGRSYTLAVLVAALHLQGATPSLHHVSGAVSNITISRAGLTQARVVFDLTAITGAVTKTSSRLPCLAFGVSPSKDVTGFLVDDAGRNQILTVADALRRIFPGSFANVSRRNTPIPTVHVTWDVTLE
jgi:hypothetical protein